LTGQRWGSLKWPTGTNPLFCNSGANPILMGIDRGTQNLCQHALTNSRELIIFTEPRLADLLRLIPALFSHSSSILSLPSSLNRRPGSAYSATGFGAVPRLPSNKVLQCVPIAFPCAHLHWMTAELLADLIDGYGAPHNLTPNFGFKLSRGPFAFLSFGHFCSVPLIEHPLN